MQCSDIQENLSAYLDGELDSGEEAELKSHLEGCESCRSELELLRSTVELVRSVPRAHAPSVLKERLVSRTRSRKPVRQIQSVLGLIAAAAILLVAVVAVFLVTGPGTPPSETTAFKAEEETVSGTREKEVDFANAPGKAEAIDKYAGEEKKELDEPVIAQAEAERQKSKSGLPVESGRGYLAEGLKKDAEAPTVAEDARPESKLGETRELLKKAGRSLEEDRKHLEKLAERPAVPRAEKEPVAGKGLHEGAPTDTPAVSPPEPAKPQDALARAEKPAEDKAVPDAGAWKGQQKLADEEKAEEHIEQLVFETPDVKTTSSALKEILSAYKSEKAEQAKEGKNPAGEARKLEKTDSETEIYIVEVSTEEYQRLIKKLKTLEGKIAPEIAEKEKARSGRARKEESNAAPRRGGGAGTVPSEAGPERRRAAGKSAPRPGFSDETKKPGEDAEPEQAEEEDREDDDGKKVTKDKESDPQRDQPKNKAEAKEQASKTVTVVIRIVKRDIPHARLLAREAKEEAAETIPDKGK